MRLRKSGNGLGRCAMLRRYAGAVAYFAAVVALACPAFAADPLTDGQWYLDFLHVDEAQRLSQGEGVVVGVIDTGVDATHPDLQGSVLPGYTVPPLNADPHSDPEGHGTGMAGLIVAHGRVRGIAPKAKILPVVATQTLRGGAFAGGVRWAVDHGATVLCLAYGGDDDAEERADIKYATDHDVVVIAGIGNTDVANGGFPAAYPGVVAAAGVDRSGHHSAISVVAPYATLAAPSDDITQTDTLAYRTRTGYSIGTGTSISTAIIAGAAALVRAKFPKLSAVEVIHRLTATADDKGPPGRDDEYGYGIVNLVKALTADVPPLTPSATPPATEAGPLTPTGNGPPVAIIAIIVIAALAAGFVALGLARRRTR
jgi:subtilisin family serine protease